MADNAEFEGPSTATGLGRLGVTAAAVACLVATGVLVTRQDDGADLPITGGGRSAPHDPGVDLPAIPVITGVLPDGRRWTVTDDPLHRLCTVVGGVDHGCDDEGPVVPATADPATPRWVTPDADDHRWDQAAVLVHAYLPPGASHVAAAYADGRIDAHGLVVDEEHRLWAMPLTPGDNPEAIIYYDHRGSEVARFSRSG